jgi:hypothetical protein
MKTIIQNTRELKSLQLLNKIKKLNSFLEQSKNCGIFMTIPNMRPEERLSMNLQFLMNGIQITKLSHKLLKTVLKDGTKKNLQELVSGPIYLLEDLNNATFSNENLAHILSYKKFTFRFLYVNQQLYRSGEVLNFLKDLSKVSKNSTDVSIKIKPLLLF